MCFELSDWLQVASDSLTGMGECHEVISADKNHELTSGLMTITDKNSS